MFSKVGTYPPAGMFSKAHIFSVLVCLAFIITALVFSRKMSAKQYFIVLKVFAVVFTILEIAKIAFSVYEGQLFYETLIPLFFCSLFIYALWLTCFKNENVKNSGFHICTVFYFPKLSGRYFQRLL